MIPVAQEAEVAALLCARNDLGPMEGEMPRDLERRMSALYGHTAEEEGELSFAKGEEVEILVDPPEDGEAWWEARKNGESGFLPLNYFNPAAVKPKVVEPILSSGSPQEATRGELPNMARALCGNTEEDGEISFAKGKELVLLNFEDAEGWGEAPKTDGNSGLVPLNRSVPPNLSAATSSPPIVIQATTTLPDPADAPAMPESEKAEVHITADPPGETETASMQQPATYARQTNEGIERNNATSVRSQICVSFPTKPGAHRAKKVALITPSHCGMSPIHTHTHTKQRHGHGKPLTPAYLFGMPFSQLRRLAEQRGIDIGGEKEQLIARLLATEG